MVSDVGAMDSFLSVTVRDLGAMDFLLEAEDCFFGVLVRGPRRR
jgi:hypothetical protein